MKQYYVYMMASKRNGTLYVGVTSNLIRRVLEHKTSLAEGFTSHYKVTQLVWDEATNDVYAAITYEKKLKTWKRAWKLQLIEEKNPHWNDLYEEIIS